MRLEKIKLAGFKSFVDPTTVPFPSNLVGIVGPNGCGKSNVIDAVRWVMGESSAKMLRGESMADVIFNGSTSRKPVGTASIELVFDNCDGSAGGQYAQYGQISVKRHVSRDGQSLYFLNSVKCRRRDIADLFLGTGLGPRSYSIIEQGMISRIIEARPEDLRNYLEEAAGISKYKERRKETKRRIEHTKENLDRLNDLRDEVQKQLRHLERQAVTAEKYKELKAEERQVKAELLVLRLRELQHDLDQRDRTIGEQENRLQAAVAEQRGLETEIERQREAHTEANDGFNDVQGRFYAIGSEIARLEEAIQFARESRRRQEAELARAEQALAEAQDHSQHDQSQLHELSEALDEDLPRLEEARLQLAEAGEQFERCETGMQAWQTEWDEFNQKATEPAQLAQVERARINQFEQQETQLRRRLERLGEERGRLADIELQAEINELERTETDKAAVVEREQARAAEAAEQINADRQTIADRQAALADARGELQTLKGRLASLQALQQAALDGSDGEAGERWRAGMGLGSAPRLLERIQVPRQWQTAVERALGASLQAYCVSALDEYAVELGDHPNGALELIEDGSEGVAGRPGTLGESARGPAAAIRLLNTVFPAQDLNEALHRRQSLQPGESLITADGTRIGSGWLSRQGEGDASAGVLAREEELRELGARQEQLTPLTAELAFELDQAQSRLADAEQIRDSAQQALDAANRSLAETRAQLSGKRARAEQIRARSEALGRESDELRGEIQAGTEAMENARTRLHQALTDMEQLGAQRDALVARRERLRGELNEARNRADRSRRAAHEIEVRVESMRSSEQSLRSGIDRMQARLQQLNERCVELREGLDSGAMPLAGQQQDLDVKLQDRIGVEQLLAAARSGLELIDHKLRELEQQRHLREQRVQDERGRLDEHRLGRQEVVVRAKTLEEQLTESGFTQVELLGELGEQARVQDWQERVERLGARIQRLGPINLAAIDEFKEQSERMEYLDRQYADIIESLETLENAIRKIDRETRTRFKETFDKVNAGLQELFPKLFGGGHAYLELTGDDLLDTGVTVMARPPGKRNSSIHLLSGGEKALTAVALVFAIFQLNPAPFCMLDEVDAPLDDANVSRFCSMVQEMSEKVQFIFITHNKMTMEIANQLTGVTMNEPGVSRLVSVDVEEAAVLAAV